jgi:hypothetical protein
MRSRRPSECRLEAQQARRVGEHRAWVRLGKAFALEDGQKHLRMLSGHVGVALALFRRVAEVAPAIDHLLGRAAADAELETSTADQIGCACILGHIERVLIAHVDDGGADLDAGRLRADCSQQREGRGELAREVMDAEVGPVRAKLLGRHGKVDGLEEGVTGRSGL